MKKKIKKPRKKAEYCDNWIGDFPPARIAKEVEDEEPEFPPEWDKRNGRKRRHRNKLRG